MYSPTDDEVLQGPWGVVGFGSRFKNNDDTKPILLLPKENKPKKPEIRGKELREFEKQYRGKSGLYAFF